MTTIFDRPCPYVAGLACPMIPGLKCPVSSVNFPSGLLAKAAFCQAESRRHGLTVPKSGERKPEKSRK